MRKIRVAATIQDEMEQRFLNMPWYLDRIEFSYCAIGMALVGGILFFTLGLLVALVVSPITIPLFMAIIAAWKRGKEPGYRWDSLYRWGFKGEKGGWLARKRGQVSITPARALSLSAFAGTKRGGLAPARLEDLAVPRSPLVQRMEDNEPTHVLTPMPAFPRRIRKYISRKEGVAPVWFKDLIEPPEYRSEKWLVKPTTVVSISYEDASYDLE